MRMCKVVSKCHSHHHHRVLLTSIWPIIDRTCRRLRITFYLDINSSNNRDIQATQIFIAQQLSMIDANLADFILKCYVPDESFWSRPGTLSQKTEAARSTYRFDPERFSYYEHNPIVRQQLLQECWDIVAKYGCAQTLDIARQVSTLTGVRAERQNVSKARKTGNKLFIEAARHDKRARQDRVKAVTRSGNGESGLWGTSFESGMKKIQDVVSRCSVDSFPVLVIPDAAVDGMKAKLSPPASQRLFPGTITIPERSMSIKQAAAESSQSKHSPDAPGRRYYYTDACLTKSHSMGVAVAWKDYQPDGTSDWAARGCTIHSSREQKTNSGQAEAWAIWLALQMIIEKATSDKAVTENQDPANRLGPCTHAVIYTDSTSELYHLTDGWKVFEAIARGGLDARTFLARACIIRQAHELQSLGVAVELRWVKGHAKVPGNELADRVAAKAARIGEDLPVPKTPRVARRLYYDWLS